MSEIPVCLQPSPPRAEIGELPWRQSVFPFSFFSFPLLDSFELARNLEAQVNTQRYGGRPYGVGLIVSGYDVRPKSVNFLACSCSFNFSPQTPQATGSHLYEFSPSGNCYDYVAISIGARAQSAKTYLEKNFEQFDGCKLRLLPTAKSALSFLTQYPILQPLSPSW